MSAAMRAVPEATAAAIPVPDQINHPGFRIDATDVVVDVGCGDGEVCVYAGHQGADVIGLDIEPALVERACERMRDVPARSFRGIVGDADPIPLPDGTASVVVCTEVLEHVDEPARFLAELVRIGRPGARYFLSVPDAASEAVMQAIAPAWYFQKPVHINIFTHPDFAALVTAAGLRVQHHGCGGFSWSMHWFLRMAIGMEHKYADLPDHPVLDHWGATLEALMGTPGGPRLVAELDRILPKSQVIVARKPDRSPVGRLASLAGPAAWKRRVKDGTIRLGGFDLQWKVRRTTTPGGRRA